MDDPNAVNRLGDYLRARRDVVTAEQAGIPTGTRRRVPGLRREELAMLAGISADYYLRLERGRDNNPSPQILQSLARVLRLDDIETEHLLSLAAPRQHSRRPVAVERVPARMRHLLATIGLPAFIEGRFLDVLAANTLAGALSPRLQPGYNRLRSLLLDPEERAFQQNWERSVGEFLAVFRRNLGDDVSHPRAIELVGELSLASARFRGLWARHDVAALIGGTITVNHPTVGQLTLHRDKLPVDDKVLVIYYPEPQRRRGRQAPTARVRVPAEQRTTRWGGCPRPAALSCAGG